MEVGASWIGEVVAAVEIDVQIILGIWCEYQFWGRPATKVFRARKANRSALGFFLDARGPDSVQHFGGKPHELLVTDVPFRGLVVARGDSAVDRTISECLWQRFPSQSIRRRPAEHASPDFRPWAVVAGPSVLLGIVTLPRFFPIQPFARCRIIPGPYPHPSP